MCAVCLARVLRAFLAAVEGGRWKKRGKKFYVFWVCNRSRLFRPERATFALLPGEASRRAGEGMSRTRVL